MTILRARREVAPRSARISALVPVLDGGPRLLTLLDALANQDVGPVDTLVVDSGSTDRAVEEAARRWPRLRVYELRGAPFDHGLVRSAGVRLARAPLVALFSQDAVPLGAGTLRRMMEAFEDRRVAGAMARQVPGPGADPGVIGALGRWTPPGDRIVLRGGGATEPGPAMAEARLDNVASMVRRAVVEEVPFPSRPFGEDLSWGREVLRRGHLLAYVPTALVEHHHDPGLRGTFARHRASHRQAAGEFGLRAVPTLLSLPGAFVAGLPGDLADGGPGWALRGAPRRLAALLGQWAGGRDAEAGR